MYKGENHNFYYLAFLRFCTKTWRSRAAILFLEMSNELPCTKTYHVLRPGAQGRPFCF